MSSHQLLSVIGVLLIGCSSSDEPAPAASDTGVSADSATTDVDSETPDTRSAACAPAADAEWSWQVLSVCREAGQLLSVAAHSWDDVWMVGAGGQVLHFNGCEWTTIPSGTTEDLWWVTTIGDVVIAAGEGGTIIRANRTLESPTFEVMPTPTDVTLYGVWGDHAHDVWAVGFQPTDPDHESVILRFEGAAWNQVALPNEMAPKTDIFKVWGRDRDEIYFVGRDGLVLFFDGDKLSSLTSPDTDWVTVTGSATETVLVGGKSAGALATVEDNSSVVPTPLDGVSALQGVCLAADGSGMATGLFATFMRRPVGGQWSTDDTAPLDLFNPNDPPVPGCSTFVPDYHACAADDLGGFYAVGGNFAGGLTEGAILYYGPPVSTDGL